jgi:hypothetical protein
LADQLKAVAGMREFLAKHGLVARPATSSAPRQ